MQSFMSLKMYSIERSESQKGKVYRTLVAQVELPHSYFKLEDLIELKDNFEEKLSHIYGELSYGIETFEDNSFLEYSEDDVIDA